MSTRTIKVDTLARVEGEGALHLRIHDRRVEHAELRIFEPPRFFEAFLRERGFDEVPDIVARICGICPVAYQMSAVQAIEDAFSVTIDARVRALRQLLYCGEWIESHVLHMFMLHAPDFLGYDSAIEMARDHRELVESALQMKKAGNAIVRVVGGREIHPINVRAGGFYRAPAVGELRALREPLQRARDAAARSVRWAAGLDFPAFERDYEFVALRHDTEYPMNEGRIVSSAGIDTDAHGYEDHFEERQVAHSTALHSVIRARGPYLVGPLARLNLNAATLSPLARSLMADIGLALPCRNPFMSILARGLEVVHALDLAIGLIEAYQAPDPPHPDVAPRAGIGFGATEAPRGLLWHRYQFDDAGLVRAARIVPPTSQNQPTIEADLRELAQRLVDSPDDALRARCEQSIRNYDPCISCSTHFLRLEIERR
jgi:sulfhydrogenase subunit alpha